MKGGKQTFAALTLNVCTAYHAEFSKSAQNGVL